MSAVERVARAYTGDLWELFEQDDRDAICDRIALAMSETLLIAAEALRAMYPDDGEFAGEHGVADWLTARAQEVQDGTER
jgi:hypothetical protein